MNNDFDGDDLFFAAILAKAEVLALRGMLAELCRQVDYRDPDGFTLDERFFRQRTIALNHVFRSLEDGNPALAARLHARYEEARRELGEDRS
jgi:hypothetical protein